MVGGSYVAGAEITNLNLIRDLYQKGYNVLVVASGWNNGDFIKRLLEYNIPYKTIKLGFIYVKKPFWTLDSLIHYPKALIQLASILSEFKPDWVFHSTYRSFLMGYILFKNKRNLYREHNNPLFNKHNQKLYQFLAKKMEYFICPSQTVKETLIKFNIPHNQVRVIPSPLDAEFVIPPVQIKSEGIPHVGIIGQIHREKGFDFLFTELSKVDLQFKIFIYGDDKNEYANNLKANLPSNLKDKITWMGFEKNRAKIYQNLDLVLFPSLSESFGRIIIEAAAFSIPTIASDISCFKEIIKHNETGLMFKLSDTSELASHLEQLLLNDAKRKKLGENAKTYVLNNFISEKCTEKFKALLNE